MELNFETVTTPPVDAASVLLLRDSDEGLQVLQAGGAALRSGSRH